MDVGLASVVPRRVSDPSLARAVVAAEGAAILTGLPDPDAAVGAGAAMLGTDCVRIGPQFEATKEKQEMEAAVVAARDSGPMFRLAAGEMICADNYRLMHGRDGYTDPARVMLSIWGWSTTAIAVPEGPLDIVRPVIPKAMPQRG